MAHKQWNKTSFKLEIMNRIYQQSGSLRKVFRSIDADGSGLIDRQAMRNVLAKFNMGGSNLDQVTDELLREADPSGDGQISFNEFSQTLKPPDKAPDAVFGGHQQHVQSASPGKGRYGYSPQLRSQVNAELPNDPDGEPETYSPPVERMEAKPQQESTEGAYEMDTSFALFKLRVLESLVNSESMQDIKGSMTAMLRTRQNGEQRVVPGTAAMASASDGTDTPLTIQMTLNQLKESLASAGARGIHGLGRKFRIFDDDGSKSLSLDEFTKATKEHSMGLSKNNIQDLFNYFDRDGSGTIAYDEFLVAIRGALNPRRSALVNQAFDVLDKDGSGLIDLRDIMQAYDASKHPDFISGAKSKAEVFREFLDTFDGGAANSKDGEVTREEFAEYYANVSASIDADDYFELMIRNAWHISGGEGWCENTTNRRVHVAWADGRHTVEEVVNDLAVGNDLGRIKAQFEKAAGQSVLNVELVGSYDSGEQQAAGGSGGYAGPGGRVAPGGDSSVVFG